ncbi:AAA family ATPase [Massilia sp. SYSU DXS3249]
MKAHPFLSAVSLKSSAAAHAQEFPLSLPVIRSLDRLALHPQVTFFVGENGSGKSTLLEAIAVAMGFNAEGGSRNFRFATRASHSSLHEHLRLARGITPPRDGFFLRAESFFNVSTEIERIGKLTDAYGGTPLHELSHGEAFLNLFMARFGGNSLFILDEPEAALSPQRQLAMLSRLHDLAEDGSQFIIATHSPILMAYPNATIYECGERGIAPIAYEDTEHYRVTHDFIANPARMLAILMER